MRFKIQIVFWISALASVTLCRPDSAGHYPPPPGLSYGGIPYGSMSGNVAEYFKRHAPSLGRTGTYDPIAHAPDFTPIQEWL